MTRPKKLFDKYVCALFNRRYKGNWVFEEKHFEQRCGCHCDLDPGQEPDECVFENGYIKDCFYAMKINRREDCEYWRKVSK